MKKITALLVAVMLLLSACSSATVDGVGKELEDTVANITDTDNKYVQMVKGGYRTDAPEMTYEDAFSSFFGTPRWTYFKGEDGQDVVEFTGDCTYRDVPVKARIQFVVDEENGTFEATYLAFNEVPQDALTLAAIISKAFEEADTSSDNTNPATNGPVNSMEEAQQLVESWLEDHPLGASALVDTGAVANEVESISSEYFVLELWITPRDFEGLIYVRKSDGYMTFHSTTDEEFDLDEWYGSSDEDIYYDDDNYTYQTLDYDLCGRWRSYDGSALALNDSGGVDTVFQFWNTMNGNPEYVTWEASNGRLTLYGHYTVGCYWIIGESDNMGITMEMLYMKEITDNNGPYNSVPDLGTYQYDSYYFREKIGTGLIGAWTSKMGLDLTFYEDGTGMVGNNYLTWWSDDDETMLYYYPVQAKSYDYTVNGDTLTVFFSDGSKIYTRVGE